MIDFDHFKKSLGLLESQHGHWLNLDKTLPSWMQEAISESVIQRFEICYDCLWKVLKRYLKEDLGIADLPNSPKPIFRIADENHLLPSSITEWLVYGDLRIDTTHAYDGEKAQAALARMGRFIGDAIALYETISGHTWREQP